jgi:hypothetical protein
VTAFVCLFSTMCLRLWPEDKKKKKKKKKKQKPPQNEPFPCLALRLINAREILSAMHAMFQHSNDDDVFDVYVCMYVCMYV